MSTDHFLLTTARLGLRWWTADDLPLAQLLWGDPEVMRYMGGPHTLGSAEERLALQLERASSQGVQYWPMFRLNGGGFIGCCGLKPPPERYGPQVLETGFHLRPAFWRQGYGEEVARAVISYAFYRRGVATLFAGRHPENVTSGNLLAKLGFKSDGEEFFPRTGLMHPCYLLHATDWAAR